MARPQAERAISDLEVRIERRRLDDLFEVRYIATELQLYVGGYDQGDVHVAVGGRLGGVTGVK
jgi:hypothetical protein